MKPRIFLASSSEGLEVAEAVHCNLEFAAEVTPWSAGLLNLSKPAFESLLQVIDTFDYAVFVLTPDDVATIRGQQLAVARDNVILELGMFLGRLGKERCFIVLPRGHEDLHLPTDLIGFSPATYEPNRSDRNLQAALVYACSQIKQAVSQHGARPRTVPVPPAVTIEPPSAVSTPGLVVDQELFHPHNLGSSINDGFKFVAQTFTAGKLGFLVALSVNIHSKRLLNPERGFTLYQLRLALHDVVHGYPDHLLGEVVLDSDQALIDELVRLVTPIPQVPGRQYAIVASYLDAPPHGAEQWLGNWTGCTGNHYLPGNTCASTDGRSWFVSGVDDFDLHFRTFLRLYDA